MAEVPEVVDGEAQPDEENLDDSGEGSVTLQEVLQSEMSLEEDARAVLGAADDRNCSYEKVKCLTFGFQRRFLSSFESSLPQGHLFRQPLYSCATCCDLKAKPAGICLGCSLHCHDGHELHELYTKRNFRCECGNDKFGGVKCNLRPVQNFLVSSNSESFQQPFVLGKRSWDDKPLQPEFLWTLLLLPREVSRPGGSGWGRNATVLRLWRLVS